MSQSASHTIAVTLPAMGESVTEGTVTAWHRRVGDAVAEGDVLAEVTTDKVDVEVPAPAAGRLSRIAAEEGQTVAVGTTIAEISLDEADGTPAAGEGPAAAPALGVTGGAASNGAGTAGAGATTAGRPARTTTPPPAEAAAGDPSPPGAGRPVSIVLPAMGESVTEGVVARWLKGAGDPLVEGEPVVEVTTDKVDVEVPSPASGRLGEIAAQEGTTVLVGGVLGTVVPGDTAPGRASAAPPPAPGAGDGRAAEEAAEEASAAAEARGDASTAPPEPSYGAPGAAAAQTITPSHRPDVPAAPLARRAAAVTGVDLAAVRGTGPGGLITRADVLAAAARGPGGRAPAAAQAPPVSAGAPAAGAARVTPGPPPPGSTPLRGPAAALAQFMEQSREIPTATSFRTIEVDTLTSRRRELNDALAAAGRKEKVSFTHLIGHAIARAATDVPSMSSHFERAADGGALRVQPGVHLGLAVDATRRDGTRSLVVPVIKNAAALGFAAFREEYERLVASARDNTLGVDDMRGASMTLTNPGGIGTVASVPRLMPGQGTIVAIGSVDYPPGLRSADEARLRELGAARVMTMTSTYDHRVIQGAESGEFLRRIEQLLDGADGFYSDVFASMGAGAPAAQPLAAPREVRHEQVRGADHEMLAAVGAAMSLVKAHRTHGHLGAHLDPLGTPPIGDPSMDPARLGLTPELMESVPADVLRVYVPGRNLAEVLPNLSATYCGTIAYELEHLSSHEQRVWLRERIESGWHRTPLSPDRKLQLLQRLTKVEAMEHYLHRAFLGQTTFSIEGLDAMVPMLEELLTMVADDGIDSVVMGMAHRGRLAIIAHVVNRPYEAILVTFEQGSQRRSFGEDTDDPTGDVKYHLGGTGTYLTESGKPVTVRLLSNPSHLEAIDPVVEGWTRAEQTRRNSAVLHVDPKAAMPLLIHGDAAFPGQGVVAEVLNLQALPGYTTGGTVHVIANNQVGFTTDPSEGRSTRYASDLAKGFDIPIIHVNADDVEACIHAMRLAYDYRRTYHRDVLVDLVGYRRYGHNEGDEPSYTQPRMYQLIKEHPSAREIYARTLAAEGLISVEEADSHLQSGYERVSHAYQKVKNSLAAASTSEPAEHRANASRDEQVRTGITTEAVTTLNEQLLTMPEGFHLNPKLSRQIERRREAVRAGEVDWATAESLALASLLTEGHPVRLTGQDTVRGTFSQRHLTFFDTETELPYTPMHHVLGGSATFELHNSPLSEAGALGFEYGYSAATPDTLVLWEAQYGDFVNGAQVIVDQFMSSAQAKWGWKSRLTLLLPHGYEGQGPEHSSARLERFLQLSSNGNIRVANCSTAAQYFHLLRQQAKTSEPRPLAIVTPKSLLRSHQAASTVADLVNGSFQPVIDDPVMSRRRDDVTTLLLCSGKVYHDLSAHSTRKEAENLAIARVELLDPIPIDAVLQVIRSYPRLERVFWVQEEPKNMGAWPHIARPIGKRRPYDIHWDYIGRPRRASPSEGFKGAHEVEQERIVSTALMTGKPGCEAEVKALVESLKSSPS